MFRCSASALRPLRRWAWARSLQTTGAGASASTGPNGYVYLPRGRLNELLCAEVGYMSTVPIRPLSMQEVLALVSSESLAELIHTDVPKRFAVRIRMIESLQGWETIPEMSELHAMMTRWYRELRLVDPHGELKQVTEITRAIRQEGSTTVGLVASGIHRLQRRSEGIYSDDFLDNWLDGFLLSRIGSNMLLDQYYACAPKAAGGLDRKTGIIQPDCDAVSLCKQAADYASRICQFHTGQRPVVVYDNYEAGTGACQPDSPCYFSYIPGYLRYIMVELLKNSFKATLTSFGPDEIEDRPIHVLICRDDTQVLIRVSDRAGGIPSHVGDRIWSYLYGAAAREAQTAHSKSRTATPLSGYGVGLPLSRLHARYLGGKLDLTSYPGFGTDISVHLPRITSDQVEEI